MIIDTVLTDTRAYIGNEVIDCNIAIDNGRIFKIGKKPNMPSSDAKISLGGLLTLPGLIDAHVHLRDEGKAFKEDFRTGTAAAVAGGFTTVLDMPNNEPVTMSAETLRNRMQKARGKILANVGFFSEFPEDKSEIAWIVKEGPVGFKFFMANQVGGLDKTDDDAIAEDFGQVKKQQTVVAVHAEDGQLLEASIERLKHNNRNDIEAYLNAHSEAVELSAVKRMINIVKKTGSRLHFCHISTNAGLNEILEAKKTNAVTCETTPHNLFLTADNWRKTGFKAITMPPVRDERTRTLLWRGISDGPIDTIGSDHAPHTVQEKEADSVWNVKAGIPGLETTLPLLLTSINKGQLSVDNLVKLLARHPAEIFHLQGRGTISKGSSADLTAVDMKMKHKIDASKFYSKAKFSPFDGWQVQGKAVKTFVNGNLVIDSEQLVTETASGQTIRRSTG